MINEIEFDESVFNDWFFDFYNDQNRYCHAYGGSGSGKSYVAVQKLIIRGLKKKHRFLCVRKTKKSIKSSVFQLFKDVISDWDLTPYFEYNNTEHTIKSLINGTTYITFGIDDPEKLKSIQGITGIWIEEATELDKQDFTQLDLRLRGDTPSYKQIILTYNPVDESHWLVKRFFENQDKQTSLHKTTYLDNKFIDEEYKNTLNELAKHDQNFYNVYCRGEWGVVNVENPFLSNYDFKLHESTDAVFDPEKPIIVSVDFNINPLAVNFAHQWRDYEGEHFHIFDEMDITQASIPKLAQTILQSKYADYIDNMIFTGDRSGGRSSIERFDNASQWVQIKKLLGLRTNQLQVPANPKHKQSRNDCNYVLSYFPDFKINPETCKNTVRDCKLVQCDAFGSIIKKNRKNIEEQADHLDNVRYFINTFLYKWIWNDAKKYGRQRILEKINNIK